ncbi:MAG: Ni/Fe hydrogenase subunit alpha [Gemmatimonadota bacterium]|nr:Ni/Fe hydrogenase subunit alpha [Gemmatimonadota bacterium]
MKRTIEVNHLARVEGHGGIVVELDGNEVSDVQFKIFEGARLIERLLRGRSYGDVAQIVSRICAICSVAHSLTSLKATEAAFGIRPSAQTQGLRDLMYRGESIESHALHLFLLALPDYLGYPSAAAMVEKHGDAVAIGLRLKKLGNAIQETLGGRAIHPVNAVLGGFGALPTTRQLVALKDALEREREDCDRMIELLAGLPQEPFADADIAFAALRSSAWYGYYHGDLIDMLAAPTRQTFAAADYRAVATEEVVGHSHAKHSRFEGRPFMVGALARLAINGDLLRGRAVEAMQQLELAAPFRNPMDNNKAQAVELVNDVEAALATVDELLHAGLADEEPPSIRPREGTGTAITEAPRGLLIHSYTYDAGGHIVRADVITPTAINAASMEDHFRHAVARSKGGDDMARMLEMIARAYDPCISCSVHVVRKDHVA